MLIKIAYKELSKPTIIINTYLYWNEEILSKFSYIFRTDKCGNILPYGYTVNTMIDWLIDSGFVAMEQCLFPASDYCYILNHWGIVMPYDVIELGHFG